MAVGTFQGAHEGALLCPALPALVLFFDGEFVGLVVTNTGAHLVIHACHCRPLHGATLPLRRADFSRRLRIAAQRLCMRVPGTSSSPDFAVAKSGSNVPTEQGAQS